MKKVARSGMKRSRTVTHFLHLTSSIAKKCRSMALSDACYRLTMLIRNQSFLIRFRKYFLRSFQFQEMESVSTVDRFTVNNHGLIQLYSAATPNGMKVAACLEELVDLRSHKEDFNYEAVRGYLNC
jgi:hypothetical protein